MSIIINYSFKEAATFFHAEPTGNDVTLKRNIKDEQIEENSPTRENPVKWYWDQMKKPPESDSEKGTIPPQFDLRKFYSNGKNWSYSQL